MTMKIRKLAAFGCTLVLALVICCLSGARALVSVGHADLAAYLPYGSIAVMRSEAPDTGSGAQGHQALAALQTSPLVAPALKALERRSAQQRPQDAAQRAQLVVLAGRLGWRDVSTQRELYDEAVRVGDFGKALNHADAIMRVSGPQQDLDNSLRAASSLPAFRKALLPYFHEQAPWSSRWLVVSTPSLSDQAVADLATSIPARTDANAFDTAARVMWILVTQGRITPALQIDNAIRRDARTLPETLKWPARSRKPDSPFAWQLGKGYAIKPGRSDKLVANDADRMGLTYRLLALPPGDYQMSIAKGQQTPGTWQWAMGCGSQPLAVGWQLEASNTFSVEEDCPLQWIALRGDLTSTPLDAMTIQLLEGEEQ